MEDVQGSQEMGMKGYKVHISNRTILIKIINILSIIIIRIEILI
jgi:hypothetical protein